LLALVVLYFVIFTARAVYDLSTFSDTDITDNYNVYYPAERLSIKTGNYASYKMDFAVEGLPASPAMDQKYERIANIVSKSVNYDNDLARFNNTLESHKAVVQMENRRGLPGSRHLELTIGVRPENFDSMQAEISLIGKITSSTITKTDKTYEYRQMLAEKETLEQRRTSYGSLRKHGGNIPELLQLEEKIIEVEAQIQQQMVGLGEYSDENALCTINYTLYEGSEAGMARKLWNALSWSTAAYLAIVGVMLFTTLAALILVLCWNSIKKILMDKPKTPQHDTDKEPRQEPKQAPEQESH
jgi:hypothetical protein